MTNRIERTTNRPAKAGSLEARITAFFEANPAEELTPDMIATKFESSAQQAQKVVAELRRRGLLEAVFVVRLASERARTAQ